MFGIRKGDVVYCWPKNFNAGFERDGSGHLTCAATVTSVTPDEVIVHYYLPEGSNGMATFSGEKAAPADAPTLGRWWHRPAE